MQISYDYATMERANLLQLGYNTNHDILLQSEYSSHLIFPVGYPNIHLPSYIWEKTMLVIQKIEYDNKWR